MIPRIVSCLLIGGVGVVSAADYRLVDLVEEALSKNPQIEVERFVQEEKQFELAAESALYVPEAYATVTRSALERENTEEQRRSQGLFGANSIYTNQDDVFEAGFEGLAATGLQYRLGLNFSQLGNTLNNYNDEYTTFAGVEITQPLLRGRGREVTQLRLRLAEVESSVAELQLRKELMATAAQAERLYWDLERAQRQRQLRLDSVAVAKTILADNRERVKQGKMAASEVRQAEAGVELRQAQQEASELALKEVANRVLTLLGEQGAGETVGVVEAPALDGAPPRDFEARLGRALEANPDYLLRKKQLSAAGVHLTHAEDQHRPKFDLVGRFGYNGRDTDSGDSVSDIGDTEYESWAVGVNLRMPLSRRQTRNRISAAESRVNQAATMLRAAETEIANLLDAAIERAINLRRQVERYERVVAHNEKLLMDELTSLERGKSDSRMVLLAEEDLSEAKSNLLRAESDYRLAAVALRLVEGSILQGYGIEFEETQP